MKRQNLILLLTFIMLFTVGCSGTIVSSEPTSESLDAMINETARSTNGDLIIPSGTFNMVSAMYENGYESINELIDVTDLIVHAVPISVKEESEFAICYILDVRDSSIEGIETVYLRQMKDEHLLEIGQEVVLALAPDDGEGYYHIPAGGAGLFTANEATAEVEGQLRDDLLESSPAPISADAKLTLDDVFHFLCNLE